jgi:hypothetical protein
MHIAEKYSSLARDAMSSGDSVAAENYLQHAEHYNRIILAAQAQNAGMPGMEGQSGVNGSGGGGRFNQIEPFQRDFDGDYDEGDGEDYVPQQRPFHERPDRPEQRNFRERQDRPEQRNFHERPERPAYNQHQQPQPYIPQNAFPHAEPQLQPIVPPANGVTPYAGENYANPQDGDRAPRRRRRRPIADPQARGFNGRAGGDHGSPEVNGSVAGGKDTAPDETAS